MEKIVFEDASLRNKTAVINHVKFRLSSIQSGLLLSCLSRFSVIPLVTKKCIELKKKHFFNSLYELPLN
jgi:hypothetical protein